MHTKRKVPRYNIISTRISDEELNRLEQALRASRTSVSDFLREAVDRVIALTGTSAGGKAA